MPLAGASADNAGSTPPPPNAPGSLVLPDNVDIAMLDINLLDYGASEVAYVRFFPNGTCDELTLVLHSGDEWQKITLEFSTALATIGPLNQMKARSKPCPRRRESRAFSLLEVMVAIGIFFMAVFAILGLVSSSLANARQLQTSARGCRRAGGRIVIDQSADRRHGLGGPG